MQRITGPGVVFLELDGGAYEYILQPGERLVCDTGSLAWMDESCKMTVQSVSGLNNVAFGGEGFFNTKVTGPGRIWLQTMPASAVAAAITPLALPSLQGLFSSISRRKTLTRSALKI